MNATRPEAEIEYSSGHRGRSGLPAARWAASVLTIAGAALLVVAELLAVDRVVTIARHPVLVATERAGPHDGFALVPIAVCAVLLTGVAWRSPRPRVASLATLVLGLIALVIALTLDRSGIHAVGAVELHGVLYPAQARAGAGIYVETLAGVLLVLGGLAGTLGARVSRPANRDATHPQQSRD